MILNIRIFDLDIWELFTKFPAKFQLRLANLKKGKLINPKSSLCRNDLHQPVHLWAIKFLAPLPGTKFGY